MDCGSVVFSGHAVQRMFLRGTTTAAVRRAIAEGEVIRGLPDDQPFSSSLLLAEVEGSPLHVLVGVDDEEDRCHIIMVYWPDAALWEPGFRQRRR